MRAHRVIINIDYFTAENLTVFKRQDIPYSSLVALQGVNALSVDPDSDCSSVVDGVRFLWILYYKIPPPSPPLTYIRGLYLSQEPETIVRVSSIPVLVDAARAQTLSVWPMREKMMAASADDLNGLKISLLEINPDDVYTYSEEEDNSDGSETWMSLSLPPDTTRPSGYFLHGATAATELIKAE